LLLIAVMVMAQSPQEPHYVDGEHNPEYDIVVLSCDGFPVMSILVKNAMS